MTRTSAGIDHVSAAVRRVPDAPLKGSSSVAGLGGTGQSQYESDIVLTTLENSGAIFLGRINHLHCGAISTRFYNNNIAPLTSNILPHRLLQPGPVLKESLARP